MIEQKSARKIVIQKNSAKRDSDWNWEVRPGGWKIGTRHHLDQTVQRIRVFSLRQGSEVFTNIGGRTWFGKIETHSAGAASQSPADGVDLSVFEAQFPGKVRKILVQAGDTVESGQKLVLLEAMKMEFTVEAPAKGLIKKINIQEGQQIVPGDRYMEFEILRESK